MINYKETFKIVPEFVLPRRTPANFRFRDNPQQEITAPAKRSRTPADIWFNLPIVYIRAFICTITLILGVGIGLITPWLAENLDGFMTTIVLVLKYG